VDDRQRTDTTGVIEGLLGASRVLVALAAQSLAQLDSDVTLMQYRALVVLAAQGPLRTVDLATELGVAPSTMTRMCDRLVRKDLVQRFRRADDRRAVWASLTVAGKDLVGQVMRQRRRAITRLVRAIPVGDAAVVAGALSAFVEAAGEPPDASWWQRWRASATIPADAVSA
jgi:DNA-binding MarR family transcriptional regulator